MRPHYFTQPMDIKIIILFIIKNFKIPIPNSYITDIILIADMANYFDVQACLYQLVDVGFVRVDKNDNEEIFEITEKGKECLSYFENRLLISTKMRILNEIKKYLKKKNIESTINANIEKINELEYAAKCSVNETGWPIFELNLYVGDRRTARTICENFKKKYNEIFKLLFNELTKDENK